MDISKLEYNKMKIVLGFVPITIFPYISFYCKVKEKCDWYEIESKAKERYFVPCYKEVGRFKEDIYFEEHVLFENRTSKRIKIIPKKFINKFIIGETKNPSFYGYFSNVRFFKKEWKKLKPFILDTIFKTEQIYDKKIKDQVENFNIDEVIKNADTVSP